ncbi:MAG TPA: hypothetical protein PLD25_22345 [Chloroflexota bacterium]|nr:hypothetical protein [Chloroflexota bacterium]
MKPLVYYCRWQGAALRLRGRDDTAVWGALVFVSENGDETTKPFHFNLQTRQLTLTHPGGGQLLQLDDMGVVVDRQEIEH